MARRTVGTVAVLVLAVVAIFVSRSATPGGGNRAEHLAAEAGRAGLPEPAGGDTASRIVVKGDWWEVAFATPRWPDSAANHHGGLDERLVALIDRAGSTLDVADYEFDLANVAQAMARASQRQVRVRMVTDTDSLGNDRQPAVQAAFEQLRQAGIPIVDDQRQAIMHDKFVVVDGEWVLTGSWNFTDGNTYRLNNNQFIARSRELAMNYSAEFEQMFSQRRFGPSKATVAPNPKLTIGGARVESYFSPEDHVAEHLIEAINQKARTSLYFLAFAFTHDGLGDTMVQSARSGVTVQGVFESTGSTTPGSEYGKLKQAGVDVYPDGNPSLMHHKVMILDERSVAFGSFNFSSNADRENDENLLIVDDPKLAEAFKSEYERVLEVARNPPGRRGIKN